MGTIIKILLLVAGSALLLYLYVDTHANLFSHATEDGGYSEALVPAHAVPADASSAGFDETGFISLYEKQGVWLPYLVYKTGTTTVATKQLSFGGSASPPALGLFSGKPVRVRGTAYDDVVAVRYVTLSASSPWLSFVDVSVPGSQTVQGVSLAPYVVHDSEVEAEVHDEKNDATISFLPGTLHPFGDHVIVLAVPPSCAGGDCSLSFAVIDVS